MALTANQRSGVAKMHPSVRSRATAFFEKSNKLGLNLEIDVTNTKRTAAEQKALKDAGKSKTTNSWHMHGLAMDVVPASLKSQKNWAPEDPLWDQVHELAREFGFKAGHLKWDKTHIEQQGINKGKLRDIDDDGYPDLSPIDDQIVSTGRALNPPTPTSREGILAQIAQERENIAKIYRDPIRALDTIPSAPALVASRPATPTPLSALNKISPPSRFPGVAMGKVTRAPLEAIPASLNAAPVGKVERAPLPDIGKFTTPARSLQHPVSVAPPSPLAAAPVGKVTKGPALAPAVDMQALAQQYSQYQPSKVTSMPTVVGMPSIPAPTGLPAAKPVATPLAHPVSVPQVAPAPVLAPALAPPTQVRDYNVAEYQAPPAAPAPTAYDVYSGLATEAKDNTGQNTVGMLPDGTSTVTNKYGVTTGMTPYGKQTAVGSIPGINSPIAKTAAKVGIPAVGSLALGPIGGILGSLAVGLMNKPGGLLSNVRNVDTMFGNIQAHAINPGLRSFPDAPSGGYRGSASFSNRSAEGMRGMSPKAAADISAGRAGLF